MEVTQPVWQHSTLLMLKFYLQGRAELMAGRKSKNSGKALSMQRWPT